MTEAARTLLPCPFCGKQPTSEWHSAGESDDCGYWGIDCCGAFCHEENEETAARLWNTRSPLPGTREEVAGVQDRETIEALCAGITDDNRHAEIPVSALVPEGWQLVPKEPTKEMVQACIWALDRWREKNGNVQGFVPPSDKYQVRWRAMLEAAPALPPAPMPEREGIREAHEAFDRMLRRNVIEECAKVADLRFAGSNLNNIGKLVGEAIRALASHDDKGPAVPRAESGGAT